MGVIRDGKYFHNEKPDRHKVKPVVAQMANKGRIDRDYEEHAHHLIQPYLPDGTPNPDFIEYYPEDAKRYGFIKEESEE